MKRFLFCIVAAFSSPVLAETGLVPPPVASADLPPGDVGFTVAKRVSPLVRSTYEYNFTAPGASSQPEHELQQLALDPSCKGNVCTCVSQVSYPELLPKADPAHPADEGRDMALSIINENLDTLAREFRCDEGLSSASLDYTLKGATTNEVTFRFRYLLQPVGATAPATGRDMVVTYSLLDGSELSNTATEESSDAPAALPN